MKSVAHLPWKAFTYKVSASPAQGPRGLAVRLGRASGGPSVEERRGLL